MSSSTHADCPSSTGRWRWPTPHPAAAKAALLDLGRPATLHELATITGYKYGAIRDALDRYESVQRITPGTREGAGLLAVRDPQDPPQPAPNPDTSR